MDKMIFKRNFLSEVILRVDFSQIVSIDSKALRAFYDSIELPNKTLKEEEVSQLEMKIEPQKQSFFTTKVGMSGTISLDGGIKMFLDHEKFLVSAPRYERFSLFSSIFFSGFYQLTKLIDIKGFKRIGNRYVNKIVLDEEKIRELKDWSKYIRTSILPKYNDLDIKETRLILRRNMNQFILGDDDFLLSVRAGVWNGNFPGIISGREFVLDMDCYKDNLILEPGDIARCAAKMNELSYKCFMSLITDDLRTLLQS